MALTSVPRRLLAAASVVTLGASLMACSSADGPSSVPEDCVPAYEFETIRPGTLTVATYDYPPATIIESDTSMTGFEGDLMMMFAAENCLAPSITSAGGAGASIPSVETGRADVAAGSWYRTNEREQIVNLSAPTALDAGAIVSIDGITSDDLEGHRIGSVSGNLWNDSLQGALGDDFALYQDDESIYGDLAAGRIDGLVASALSAQTRFQSNPIEGAQVVDVTPRADIPEFARPGQLTFPTSKDNQALTDALDASIAQWHADGTIANLFEEYGLDPELTNITEVYNL